MFKACIRDSEACFYAYEAWFQILCMLWDVWILWKAFGEGIENVLWGRARDSQLHDDHMNLQNMLKTYDSAIPQSFSFYQHYSISLIYLLAAQTNEYPNCPKYANGCHSSVDVSLAYDCISIVTARQSRSPLPPKHGKSLLRTASVTLYEASIIQVSLCLSITTCGKRWIYTAVPTGGGSICTVHVGITVIICIGCTLAF